MKNVSLEPNEIAWILEMLTDSNDELETLLENGDITERMYIDAKILNRKIASKLID